MPVLLLRHAKAGSRREWEDDDRLRPLSPAGASQAQSLVERLASFTIDGVLSSPFVRCTATVEPLAALRGLPVGRREELAEGRSSLAFRLVELLCGEDVVVCTHGDVVPEVLYALARAHRFDLPANLSWAKGSTWVLEDDGRRFTGATYLPPPDR